jgi:hypothetical protein
MLKEKLIQQHIKLWEKTPEGWSKWILWITKETIKNILEYAYKDIWSTDILTKKEIDKINHELIHIGNISIVDFFQYHTGTKIKIVKSIKETLWDFPTEESVRLITMWENLITDLENNITDENWIINFLQQTKEYLAEYSSIRVENKKRLLWIITQEKISETISDKEKEILTDFNNFKNIIKSDQTSESYITIIKNNLSFLHDIEKDIDKSYTIFVKAIQSNNFRYAKIILQKRKHSLQEQWLLSWYNNIMNSILHLEFYYTADSELIKDNIVRSINDVYNLKDDYLAKNIDNISLVNLHSSVWDSFHDTLKSIKNLIAYSQIKDLHTSSNDLLKYLIKNKEIDKLTYQVISRNDYKISLDEIDRLAKESFEKIIKRSSVANERDTIEDLRIKKKEEAEKNKENKPTIWEKIINKLQDGLVYGRHKLLQFSKTLKWVPKALIMWVILVVVVLIKILQSLKSLIENLFKSIIWGDSYIKLWEEDNKGKERNDNKTEERNDNNWNNSDNKLLETLVNVMRSQSIKDLLNAMFDWNLMSMSNKENNLRNERDIMNRWVDKLSRVNIINYHKLDNTLLVWEVFFRLKWTKRQKENINHNNQHVLETNQDGLYSQDYSFFLDKHKREIHYEKENDYPTLVLDTWSLTKGFNSIVCPRWYIPMLSLSTKQSLQEQWIIYKLYCIKNLGYYYLKLDKVPNWIVDVHYVRYGDRDYNGIFFNTLENQWSEWHQNINSLLTEKILDISDVPENIQGVINEQSKIRDAKTLCEFSTKFLSDNFLYSKESWNTTQQYTQHSSYMSGIAHVGIGDCKNVNSLNIWLLREQNIQTQECAWYVRWNENNYEGHGVTEANIEDKCLLLDATPSKEAESKKEENEKKEKKDNESLSLMKTFIAELAENINKKYKKRMTWLKAKEKIDTELFIQKNISWWEGELKNILSNYNRNIYSHSEKIYSELLLSHINSLIIKRTLSCFPTHDKNQLLSQYYERLKNIYAFCDYSRSSQDEDLIQSKENIISELAQINEDTYQIMGVLHHIASQKWIEINIDSINQKIIEKKLLKQRSVSNSELAHEIASEIVVSDFKNDSNTSLLTDAIETYISKVFDVQFLPYDIGKHIDTNDGRFEEQKELFNKNEKDFHINNKQDISPNKVKNIVTKEFWKIKESLEGEIYKRHKSNVRTILLSMLDRVYKEFNHTDDLMRVWWDKEKLNEFVEWFKDRTTFKSWKRIKSFPNQNLASQLYVLATVCNWYDRNTDVEDKITGEEFKKEYFLVLNILHNYSYIGNDYDYKDIKSMEFLQNNFETNNHIFLAWFINYLKNKREGNMHREIFIWDKEIDSSQMVNEIFPFLEEKLLEYYSDNPCAIVNLLTSKKSFKTKDITMIKSNFKKIVEREDQWFQEKLVIEKSIFSIIEMIINSKESDIGNYNYWWIRNPYLLWWGYGWFYEEKSELILLQDLLSSIPSDQIIDIVQKIYNIFYLEEKKYRKWKTDDSSSWKIFERNEILNMRKIIKPLLTRLQNYTLHNKKSITLTLLEFKLNQLYGRIREM